MTALGLGSISIMVVDRGDDCRALNHWLLLQVFPPGISELVLRALPRFPGPHRGVYNPRALSSPPAPWRDGQLITGLILPGLRPVVSRCWQNVWKLCVCTLLSPVPNGAARFGFLFVGAPCIYFCDSIG